MPINICHRQFFCEDIFCFEKHLFIETAQCVIQEILIYLLTACNLFLLELKIVSIDCCSLFIVVLQKMLSLSAFENDKCF